MDIPMNLPTTSGSSNFDEFENGNEGEGANGGRGCTICRLEMAKVSHFGVPICTGCRAFFRRSVAQQKTYRCLNSRLCGAQGPVPSRRVCKFCRFQRCVASGMLKSKQQFQLQMLENNSTSKTMEGTAKNALAQFAIFFDAKSKDLSKSEDKNANQFFPLSFCHRPDIFAVKNAIQIDKKSTTAILEQFMLCRRKIAYERMEHFYGDQNGEGGGNSRQLRREKCRNNMHHAIKLGWKEAGLFNRILLGTLTPFNELKGTDRDALFLEFAYCWSVLERIWSTIRNCGHQARRMYDFDGQFWQVNEDGAQQYYGDSLAEILKEPDQIVHQAIMGFFFAGAFAFLNAAKEVSKILLDEEEASALALLIFTRQEVLGMVSQKCAKILQQIRHRTLKSLAQHVASQGRNMAQRIGQITALIQPVQEVVLICKRSAGLMRSACIERSLPDEFLQLMGKVELEMQQLRIVSPQ